MGAPYNRARSALQAGEWPYPIHPAGRRKERARVAVTIGSLLVDLRASTAAFAKDLDKAQQLSFNTAKQIERSWNIIGTAIAGAASAAAGALVRGNHQNIHWEAQLRP